MLAEEKYKMIILAPNRVLHERKLRLLRVGLSAVLYDNCNERRCQKAQPLYMIVLNELLGLELFNFLKQI